MVKKTIIKSKRAIFVISLIFLLVLLMLPSVHSALTDGLMAYYNMSSLKSATGSYDLTNGSGFNFITTTANCKIGKCVQVVEAKQGAKSSQINIAKTSDYTIIMWVNLTSTATATYNLFSFDNFSASTSKYNWDLVRVTSSRNFRSDIDNGNGNQRTWKDGWTMITMRKKGTERSLWFNTTLIDNETLTTTSATGKTKIGFGRFSIDTNTYSVGANFDEAGLWNRSLTTTEISSMWNSGAGYYPFVPPTPANFTIRIYDAYSTAPLTNFNVSIKNNTKTWNFTTTTGIVNAYPFKINQAKPLINITIKTSNYFNKFVPNYNISKSGNLNQSVIQAVLNIIPKQKVTGVNVSTGFTFRINGGATIYTNPISLLAGTYNITFNKTGWYLQNQVYTVAALSNTTKNLTNCYYKRLNVTVYAGSSSTLITGATINVSWLNNVPYSEQVTPSGAYYVFNVINGTYRISGIKPGSYIAKNYSFSPISRLSKYNLSLYQWNTFNITTINEETLLKIFNTSVIIYGTTSTYNKTVLMPTGIGNLSLLVPDLYVFDYKDNFGRYTERFRYITMVNGTYNNIPLYLLNSSKGSTISVTVLDQVGNYLNDYIVVAEKFLPASYQYIPVESELTNAQGLTQLTLLTGNNQYRWKVVRNNEIIYLENLSKIFSTTKTIKVTLGSVYNIGQNTFNAWQLGTLLYIDNNSKTIFLNWTTLSGTSGTICMNVTWQSTNASKPLQYLAGECSSDNSGYMYYEISPTQYNGKGTVSAIAWIKGSTYITNILNVVFGSGVKLWNIIGNDGWLVYMILMIVGACFMITNITAMPMVLAVIHFACWGMGLIPINVGITGIAVIAVLILISLRLEK